jgi:hypothetical protein
MQLLPYFERFTRDQIMIFTFEELIRNTTGVFQSICRWLKLDVPAATPAVQADNTTPEMIVQPIWSGAAHRLRHENRLVRLALDCAPISVRKIGRRMLMRQINRLNINASEVVQYLRPLQRRQTEELTQLIGREFPEWTTLNPQES